MGALSGSLRSSDAETTGDVGGSGAMSIPARDVVVASTTPGSVGWDRSPVVKMFRADRSSGDK